MKIIRRLNTIPHTQKMSVHAARLDYIWWLRSLVKLFGTTQIRVFER